MDNKNLIKDENEQSIYDYLISQIKYNHQSSKILIPKIFDIVKSKNVSIDIIIIYLSKKEEKGIIDYLINLINIEPTLFDKSYFYLYQLITFLTYKQYIDSIEQHIINKGILADEEGLPE